jgi:rfaE bifunctional protein kinase chain/domain
MSARLESIIAGFSDVTVGVVGDMAADVYVYGAASRLSREAPVLVVRHESEEVIPGCSANTVQNVVALGAAVRPFGLLGRDAEGLAIQERLAGERVHLDGLLESLAWRTITKTRILVGAIHRSKQQVLRLDREPPDRPPESAIEEIVVRIGRAADDVDVWIVSDYDYGLVTPAVFEAMRATGRPVVVDSRSRLLEFRGAAVITPNEDEAGAAVPLRIRTRTDCRVAGRHLLERTEAQAVLVTRGNQGMALFTPEEPQGDFIPITGSDEITDNTGAGDTVAASLALSLAAGATPGEAMRLANHAAGVVVMKAGAATLDPQELIESLRAGEESA